jgi:arginine repressor
VASTVALGVDQARLEHVAGTIAGDDCIFIAPSKGVPPAHLSRDLTAIWLAKEQL